MEKKFCYVSKRLNVRWKYLQDRDQTVRKWRLRINRSAMKKSRPDIETQRAFRLTARWLTMFNGKLVVMQLISRNAMLAAIWKSVLREDNTLSYCECRIISYCNTL